MTANPELSKYASAIASIRWNRMDEEQRREATRKAREASIRAAKKRREARENGGVENNG